MSPHSSPDGKSQTMQFIREHFNGRSTFLDVGPGIGTYADMLVPHGFTNVDAVEIYAPYIERFNLRSLYKTVHVGDIRTFVFPKKYDCVILGDVLEHINVEDSQRLIARLRDHCMYALFSVPWMYPQDPIGGNEAERHLQPDLTLDIMKQRYPTLQMFHNGPAIGVYYLIGSI